MVGSKNTTQINIIDAKVAALDPLKRYMMNINLPSDYTLAEAQRAKDNMAEALSNSRWSEVCLIVSFWRGEVEIETWEVGNRDESTD